MSEALDWSAPVLVAAQTRGLLTSNVNYADAFFLYENRRLRKLYIDTGNPSFVYLCGRGLADLGAELNISGCAGLGTLDLTLAEMLIASGASAAELDQAESYLIRARDQLEKSEHIEAITHLLGQWYMMMAVVFKARGKLDDYGNLLRSGVSDEWMTEHAPVGDRVPVVRQRTMMTQDLNEHLRLLSEAHVYKVSRPLEYYRTLKRVMEFLTNNGLVKAASQLEPDFLLAFSRSSDRMPLIGRISFARDEAQLKALKGDQAGARELVDITARKAQAAGLFGQVRQLNVLMTAITSGDVRGALKTFRVLPLQLCSRARSQIGRNLCPVKSSPRLAVRALLLTRAAGPLSHARSWPSFRLVPPESLSRARSSPASRVHVPGSSTIRGCPAVTDGLDGELARLQDQGTGGMAPSCNAVRLALVLRRCVRESGHFGPDASRAPSWPGRPKSGRPGDRERARVRQVA